ncbi:fibroin heavy chain isoform X6 [Acanthopagrus latus]|uniref:fibroin heavy chain isoform X6 n=1 Tax=Acanthopagrus latus TaxID=8177 RepID=UPI00187C44C3|nr:fibroin heavy chain isoform X6 [Acanthopagrus latus]
MISHDHFLLLVNSTNKLSHLVLCCVQFSGVKPQSVSWGRVLPARGVGIGVKPGVAGALGALGSRYGAKAMKTGMGRYPGAQLGAGGYRVLGLGSRAGLKPGAYGTQGAYGAHLGTGMGLGTGLTNGLGLSLGQGPKRAYGAGHGTLPGYGALAGLGYPGARPGIGLGYAAGQKAKAQKPGASTADLGGPELARLGQTVQDLMREKSRALGPSYGKGDKTLGPEMAGMRRTNILGATAPEAHAGIGFRPAVLTPGREVKSLDSKLKSSSLGRMTPFDKNSESLAVSQGEVGENYDSLVSLKRGTASHGATPVTGGVRQQLPLEDNIRGLGHVPSPVQRAQDYDLSSQQNQWVKNCGSTRGLSDALGINRHEHLGPETQRGQGLVPQPHAGKDSKHLGHASPQTLPQTQDVRGNIFSPPQGQAARNYVSAIADRQGVKDLGLVAQDTSVPRIRGTIAVDNNGRGPLNLQVQGGGNYAPVIPGTSGTQSLGVPSVEGQEAHGYTADGKKAKHLSHAEHEGTKSNPLTVPGQTGTNTHASSYGGGAGLGASLGAGGYGAGLGQGAYLGGAAGKLGGYGDGATGYLGAVPGNGLGYGNGYSDGYGAGLGYPAELADVAENKAGKSEALSTGGYAGPVQGAYGALGAGALGTGLESAGGKYGGGAPQVPYGNAPVIPTGLEGDGGYPYSPQQIALGAEGAKTASKYGAGAGYGVQQTGYGAQLGAAHDALGEQAGKYGVNGYKG